MNRTDRDKAVAYRMEISAESGILLAAGGSDPVNRAPPWVCLVYHRFGFVAVPEARYLPALQVVIGQIRHIDVEYGGRRQPVTSWRDLRASRLH